MNFGYYPGCSLEGSAREFDKSLKKVLSVLSTGLQEVDDWSCCGASSAHASSRILSTALPARNLMLAGTQGMKNVVAPCAACYNRLVSARHEMEVHETVRSSVNELSGMNYSGSPQILNIIQLFQEIGTDKIKENIRTDLHGVRAACYYGCLLLRPFEITGFDDAENPSSMEALVTALGAKTVSWNFKTECCGASHSIAHTEIVETLSARIIKDAKKHGADVIIVACPMCHSNLDMRQVNMIKKFPGFEQMPVLYLTELIGIAFGVSPEELGIDKHFIPFSISKAESIPAEQL